MNLYWSSVLPYFAIGITGAYSLAFYSLSPDWKRATTMICVLAAWFPQQLLAIARVARPGLLRGAASH